MISRLWIRSLYFPYILSLILTFASFAQAQKVLWQQQFSKGQANIFRNVRLTLDSNFIAAGTASSTSSGAAFSIRASGSTGTGAGPVFDFRTTAYDVVATADSGYLVVGWVLVGIDHDLWLGKVSKAGVVEWTDSIAVTCQAGPFAVTRAADGGYLIAGEKFCSESGYNQDYWLLKLNQNFGVDWEQTWSKGPYDILYDVAATSDGGFIATGEESGSDGSIVKAYTVKLNSGGGIEWEHFWGGNWTGGGRSVCETSDSGYVVAAVDVGADDWDNMVQIRLNKSGTLVWAKEYEYPRHQFAEAITLTPDGGAILVGANNGPGTNLIYDIFALRTDFEGNEIWHKSYGTDSLDYGYGVAADKSGYVICGYTNYRRFLGKPIYEAYLLKVADAFQTFTVRDALHDTIPKVSLEVLRVKSGPPNFTDSLIATVTTNSLGQFTLPDTLVKAGDTLKIRKFIVAEPAVKHKGVLGTMYSIFLDNAKFDSLGAMSYFIIPDSTKFHEIVMDHTTIKGNLVVSVEWDAKEPYLQTTEAGFRSLANYLYDVTDGQFQIDTIAIFDNGDHWNDADMRVHASNMEWPSAIPLGWKQPANSANPTTVFLPRRWFGNLDLSRNGTFTSDPLDMNAANDYRTRGHELGHYMFGFRDEYEFALSTVRCANAANYGYMDYHYFSGGVLSSEMSTQDIYLSSVTCQNTNQWTTNGMSCWPFFESQYEKRYTADSIFVPILQPYERDLMGANKYFPGPNDNVATPDYDVGAQVVFPNTPSPPSADTYTLIVCEASSGLLVSHANVTDFKPIALPPSLINQGQTNDNGLIKLLGVNASDVIYSSGYRVRSLPKAARRLPLAERTWLFGEADISQSGKSRLGNEFKRPSDDSLELTLKSPAGNFPFVSRLTLSAATAELDLDVTNGFAQLPTLDQNLEGGNTQSYSFTATANGYQTQINNDLAGTGELKIWAVDDSAAAFFVDTHYKTTPFDTTTTDNEIFAFDGSARVLFDNAGSIPDRATILTSRYPVPRNGLQVENLQAGEAQTLALQPATTISGDSRIIIRYSESDLGDSVTAQTLEGSLRIFRWDTSSMSWNPIGGSVDSAFNEVTARITAAGVYAAFTTGSGIGYGCGDADGDGTITIADAVFLVNYIFAGGAAPSPYVSGDADCDGSINIADAVYLINYIFAGGAAPCAACP